VAGSPPGLLLQGAKKGFLSHRFENKNDHFTKTGSGRFKHRKSCGERKRTFLQALSFVDHPERIRKSSSGEFKAYNEATMASARLHIAPTRLSEVEREAKKRRADAASAVRCHTQAL
jgi:hypothetical protein